MRLISEIWRHVHRGDNEDHGANDDTENNGPLNNDNDNTDISNIIDATDYDNANMMLLTSSLD